MKTSIFQALCMISLAIHSVSAELYIDDHGFWHGEEAASEHITDFVLAEALVNFLHAEGAETVVDFGCGMGEYVKYFRHHGINCDGFDGNPETPILTGGVASVADLSQPFDLGTRYDWVMSLEVGEHLPKIYEETFIENLDRHNINGIILSWALVGQGGYGHFNEQNNDYIKDVMASYGYTNDPEAESYLRSHCSLFWFANTVMVFRR